MLARARAAGLCALLLVAGCTSFAQQRPTRPDGAAAQPDRTARVVTAVPDDPLTVVPDADPVAAAVSASRALFDRAEVAVVARDGDLVGTLLGASAAVGLGVPLLLQPAGGGLTADPLGAELDRLGTRAVLAVGTGNRLDDDGRDVVAVAARPDAVTRVTGLRLSDAEPDPGSAEVDAVARLDPRAPAALRPTGAAQAPTGAVQAPTGAVQAPTGAAQAPTRTDSARGRLPKIDRPPARDGVAVLATDGPETLAGVATARAAGARVQVLAGRTDPRSSPEVVAGLADDRTAAVVTLGAALAANPDLDWEVATARTGTQLPGGGQTLFPGRMLVALYGTPGTPALGVLGEQGLAASIQRARTTAATYEKLVDVPVVPAFEIIATIASSAPGPDGNYSTETDPETLRPWVQAARDAGLYVVLDLQPGRTDFLTQAKAYSSLLELPNVGLALDPEWRLGPGQRHLEQIGSVGVDEVNGVASWLAGLTRERRLPQKLLLLHQFRLSMISGRDRLDTANPELAVMVHADGQGSQGEKQATWRALHQNLPPGPLFWGWKNFYDEDRPMLTPEQTIGQVQPRPDLVSYQ